MKYIIFFVMLSSIAYLHASSRLTGIKKTFYTKELATINNKMREHQASMDRAEARADNRKQHFKEPEDLQQEGIVCCLTGSAICFLAISSCLYKCCTNH